MLLIDKLNAMPAANFEVLEEYTTSTPRKYPGSIYKSGRIPTKEYREFESFITESEENPVYAYYLLEQLFEGYIGKVPLSELVPLISFCHDELELNIQHSKELANKYQSPHHERETQVHPIITVLQEPFSDYHEMAALVLMRHLVLILEKKPSLADFFKLSREQRLADLVSHFKDELLMKANLKRPTLKLMKQAHELAKQEMEKDYQELKRVSLGRISREEKAKRGLPINSD